MHPKIIQKKANEFLLSFLLFILFDFVRNTFFYGPPCSNNKKNTSKAFKSLFFLDETVDSGQTDG